MTKIEIRGEAGRVTPEERAAAIATLDRASEFRFVYWAGDGKAQRYTVKRDLDHRSSKWGIFEGEWLTWTGERWEELGPKPEAFHWPLDEALKIAEKLAYKENQYIVETMERRFPGRFRGGEYDFARTWTGAS
ncbi:hypothetical protein ACIOHC_36195 [Streptomyces sp. NPDC088252]|uniref:hypothetical protein n=1 Tax=Streptomyces sp. NPDC088252 TaxID=3365845 RepID=UPI003814E171